MRKSWTIEEDCKLLTLVRRYFSTLVSHNRLNATMPFSQQLHESLFRILCKYLFSEVAVQAVTELDNKAAHCHTPVPQWHRPFL